VQKIMFWIAVGLLVISIGISIFSISSCSANAGKLSREMRNAQERSKALKDQLASASDKLAESQKIAEQLQSEIGRVRELYRGSETARRESIEKLTEFERIIGAVADETAGSDNRARTVEIGLDDIEKELVRIRSR
jgi:septal ring factor EnvC (AmiA/AmiB activator)